MQTVAETFRQRGQVIGFVPTMGYLHEGHLSLIRIAREKGDIIIISIYVNPTQFGPDEDLNLYPRDFSRDEELAKKEGVHIIFYPSDTEMYRSEHLTVVRADELTNVLCGTSRPHHFQGVTTICTKLFHIVKPHFVVFGQKDYQQSLVIRRMIQDLNFDMEIIVAPIVREPDGLAMSSRNQYLSAEERQSALSLFQSLNLAQGLIHKGEKNSDLIIQKIRESIESYPYTKIDYISIVDPYTLKPLKEITKSVLIALAVFVGKTRLIDNFIVNI